MVRVSLLQAAEDTVTAYGKGSVNRQDALKAVRALVTGDEVTVSLEATEPSELLAFPTPDGVWMRVKADGVAHGFPIVEVRGPQDAVRQLVLDNWGEEVQEEVLPA